MQREMDRRFLSALEVFRKYKAECGVFQTEIDRALHQLELLQTDYKFVTDKTGTVDMLPMVHRSHPKMKNRSNLRVPGRVSFSELRVVGIPRLANDH